MTNYSAEIAEAMGWTEMARNLRWFEPTAQEGHEEAIARRDDEIAELREELEHAAQDNARLIASLCPTCKTTSGRAAQ